MEFEPDSLEALKRMESNYTGFVFDFNTAPAGESTPNGMLQGNQVNTNPFLSTLPGDGNGQTIVTMGPCAGNTPHTHPRGSEISYVLRGNITFGMVEENAGRNNLVIRNITEGQTIHVPTGLLHFSMNTGCTPAAFLANFATKDPGTQTMWASMMAVPNNILHAATGIPENTFSQLKSNYPLVSSPGTGGEECLRRCGLSFNETNRLTPLPGTTQPANPNAVAGKRLIG
jgi:oxalate decarboxylase/phosphoglucose isomerase-like protein (cupin superfamily)